MTGGDPGSRLMSGLGLRPPHRRGRAPDARNLAIVRRTAAAWRGPPTLDLIASGGLRRSDERAPSGLRRTPLAGLAEEPRDVSQ